METSAEQAYDDITRTAASLCGTPIALISLIDGTRQWFKSRVGVDAAQTAREHSFCAVAIDSPDAVTVINDAREDPRFAANPLVTGEPRIRFYAGAPLVTAGGHALGTVCVIDTKPRQLRPDQLADLEFLARQVVAMLEARTTDNALARTEADAPAFMRGGSVSGELMRRHDWTHTELGPPATWPEALQNAVRLILASTQPMRVTWGASELMLYNDAYVEILGDRHPRALGKPLREVWSQAIARLDAVLARVRLGESVQQSDLSVTLLRRGREEEVLLSYSWIPLRSADEAVAGVLCVCREQRDIEGDRDRELQRLRDLFEQSPSFIAVLEGPEHVFRVTNPSYLRLIGLRDVIGLPVRTALPEIGGQGFYELLDGVYKSGEPFVGREVPIDIEQIAGQAPERRYVDFTYQPLRSRKGEITGVFVEGVDVTSAKQANDIVRVSEEKFRTFAQVIPNQVWAALPDGKVDWFNDQALAYSGLDTATLHDSGWNVMVHPDDVPEARRAWARAVADVEPYQTEFRLRRHDGVYRWHLARALPIRDAAGHVTRWIGSNTDIDDQRSARASLEALNSTLERRVEERTRERASLEDQLRQTQKMEALGQLTGGIAHDFNNMLASIMGSIELTNRRLAQGRIEQVPHLLEQAESSVRRAAALTQRLLAFARRQPLQLEQVDVAGLLHSLEDMFVRAVGPGVRLRVSVASDLWPSRTDAAQLESALLNLVINARDAMPDGGNLHIDAANGSLDARYAAQRAEVRAGDYVVVRITDDGAGMPADVLAKAFDPFFTTKPLGQGTGLGLSMVFGFIKQIGGHVRLHSGVGDGTTLTLYLPRDDARMNAGAAHTGAAQLLDATGETILLVEDDDVLRALQGEVLGDLGYAHIEAEDAPAALRVLESKREIDLMLTDVGLPGMNGRQLADLARKLRPRLPIVFLTGFAGPPGSSEFLEANMHLMTKPIGVEALGERLREILQRQKR